MVHLCRFSPYNVCFCFFNEVLSFFIHLCRSSPHIMFIIMIKNKIKIIMKFLFYNNNKVVSFLLTSAGPPPGCRWGEAECPPGPRRCPCCASCTSTAPLASPSEMRKHFMLLVPLSESSCTISFKVRTYFTNEMINDLKHFIHSSSD